MTYTAQITIGHNVANAPMFSTSEICDYVTEYLNVEGFTALECVGMWHGQAEKSTRLEISGLNEKQADTIRANVPALAQALAQQAIMFELRADRVEFIEAETIEAIQTA